MIQIALVDDDLEHLQLLKTYLQQYSKQENITFSITEFHNGLDFVEDYRGELDVVFLDIEMPHMDGIEAAKKIREKDQSLGIVFVTNMAQYAIKGYEVNAIDFIVKPVEYYIFTDKLKKAIEFSRRNEEKQVVLETENGIVKIKSSQITYIEKDKNYLVFHTHKETYRVRGTLSSVEEDLKNDGFSKCINGCLVNLKYVTKTSRDEVWMEETQLPISRQRRKEFKEDFMKYIGGIF